MLMEQEVTILMQHVAFHMKRPVEELKYELQVCAQKDELYHSGIEGSEKAGHIGTLAERSNKDNESFENRVPASRKSELNEF